MCHVVDSKNAFGIKELVYDEFFRIYYVVCFTDQSESYKFWNLYNQQSICHPSSFVP